MAIDETETEQEVIERMRADIPAGAFANCTAYISIDWVIWFPDHCYTCHSVNESDDGDTSQCGPHCGEPS